MDVMIIPADFITKALAINPGMQRAFKTPSGVYQQQIKNELIYYTDTSRINFEQIEQTERLKEADNILW